MSEGFTPGPWLLQETTVYALNEERAPVNRFTASIDSGWRDSDSRISRDEVEANARLICAAPDLFIVALCEEALDMPNGRGVEILERYGWSHADRFERPATEFVRDLRRAAIAKARATA